MPEAARAVSVTTQSPLAGADFADAYEVIRPRPRLAAADAAKLAFARMPSWVSGLMSLRNILVRPLGLKTASTSAFGPVDSIGFFPVVSRTPEKVVLGFDDRHLDFRIVIDVVPASEPVSTITATTFVKTNGLLGRSYLCAVLPFHRIIVPTLLGRLATT